MLHCPYLSGPQIALSRARALFSRMLQCATLILDRDCAKRCWTRSWLPWVTWRVVGVGICLS
eukprot:338354-Rhodomonas_salina.2